MNRPNILLIISDSAQQSAYGCYGHPRVRTPFIDALARDGVVFTNAFTTAPVCHPARSSIDTGLFPQHSGILNNSWGPGTYPFRISDDAPSYVRALKALGYRTAYTGQKHLREHLFDDVVPGSYTAFRMSGLRETARSDRPRHAFYGELDLPLDRHRDAFTVHGAISLLRQYAASDRPWLIQCEFDGPHYPLVIPKEYARMYDPASVEPPPNFDDPFDGKQEIHARAKAKQINEPFNDTWRNYIAHYWGYVSMLDAFTGEILAELERLGLDRDTLVIYTSDHGDLIGAHGIATKYPMMYDEVLKVPLVARLPGRIPAGRVCREFVSHVDLLPTLIEFAGGAVEAPVHGRSWAALACGESASWPRTSIYAQLHGFGPANWFSLRMVRTEEAKYVFSPFAVDELYDLRTDPGELRNVARERPELLQEMRGRLLEWMEAVDDSLRRWL
mgnify:CR=1 FL=1